MLFLAGIIVAAIGWALWAGKIKLPQLPPIMLALVGVFMAVRGQWIFGIPAIVIAATWFQGMKWRLFGTQAEQSHEYALAKARRLLGASSRDDASIIRMRHRTLIADNHPDTGGNDTRAAMLNDARDLLLREIEKDSG